MTKIINIIGGPCAGKSTLASYLFFVMKKLDLNVEYVQEYIKNLIYNEQFDKLNDQYMVSYNQYKSIKVLQNKLDYVILDTSLLSQIYYNETNINNVSNVEKTKENILKWYNEFENINIFLNRGNIKFEKFGRIHDREESLNIDNKLKELLNFYNFDYYETSNDKINNDETEIQKIISYVK